MKWIYQKNDVPVRDAGKKVRYKVTPAAYVIPVWQGKILLARRFQTGYEDGNYSLVAGHVERGETFVQCIVRETREEIGIIVQPDDLEMVHTMHRKIGKDSERVDLFFVTTRWQGEITNCEPHKCDDLLWCDGENLPQNTIPYIAQAVQMIINDVPYSEHGWR
ncbi:MAG: NUDIX domain-containing protein [Parcubacteria group bacterium]|jgi:8-oxo-dGTP pyrophosphatase MutT (NUDIX family)